MKVSVPLRDGPELPENNDPYVDPSRMPRFSSPLSFLSKRAFLVAVMLLSVVLVSGNVSAATDCVCNYDSNKDYFPVKLSPQFATTYSVEYFKSYKRLNITGPKTGTAVLYAYLCGTPRPAEATDENSIQIPIDSAAITSTTFLPLISYLGARGTIRYAAASGSGLPACLRKMYLNNSMAAGYDLNASSSAIISTSMQFTGETVDAVFTSLYEFDGDDYYHIPPMTDIVRSSLGTHPRTIPVSQERERNPLAIIEWVEPIAALYNREAEAANVVSSIQARYNCLKNLVTANPPAQRKKVLWGNVYGGSFSFGKCPNYYCNLIQDAGGEIVVTHNYNQNETEALSMVAQADVWIYPDGNFLKNTSSNPVFYDSDGVAKFGNFSVIKDKHVFDYLGAHNQDWWDYRVAEPDVFLMDLLQALWGDTYIDDSRKKRFIRNVFTEDEADQSPRDPNTCPDVNAPLYTDWLSGPCFVTGSSETAATTAPLCASSASDLFIVRSMAAVLAMIMAFLVA